jgi:hypothetical protein
LYWQGQGGGWGRTPSCAAACADACPVTTAAVLCPCILCSAMPCCRYGIADFFELQYAGLANFEERQEDFVAESVMLRRKFASGEDGGGWGGWVHWQRGGCGTEEGQPGGSARQCACCCGNPLLELPSPHVPMLPTITAAARTACAACRGRGRERLPAPQRREAAWAGAGAQHGQGVGGGEGQQGPQSPRTQGEWHERRWLAGWLPAWLRLWQRTRCCAVPAPGVHVHPLLPRTKQAALPAPHATLPPTLPPPFRGHHR